MTIDEVAERISEKTDVPVEEFREDLKRLLENVGLDEGIEECEFDAVFMCWIFYCNLHNPTFLGIQ